jgi:transposase InsO family protein
MKYAFIEEYRYEHRIDRMCRVLDVSRSGYYRWWRQAETKRESEEKALLDRIKEIYKRSRGTYGSPRITAELKAEGIECSKNRVARIMRKNGIIAKTKRKFRITTRSKHSRPVAENIVKQEFVANGPNKLWTSDITYIWTKEGWLYLAIILDVFSRGIVGWSLSVRLTTELVLVAFNRALKRRQVTPGMIFHSDRGSQYASEKIQEALQELGIRQSMSGSGNCYDNAITESAFHTIKTELIYFNHYETRQEAAGSIFEYIEVFYNRQRRHSSLNNNSPFDFEQQYFLS